MLTHLCDYYIHPVRIPTKGKEYSTSCNYMSNKNFANVLSATLLRNLQMYLIVS
jgi:hypothetical protein